MKDKGDTTVKKQRCNEENCNQFVIHLGDKNKCKIHFYIELGERIVNNE